MRYNDDIFDTLLTDACAETRRRELAALDALAAGTDTPAFAPAPARRPRRLFALAAAAALCTLLTTGIFAAWPTVKFAFENGRGLLTAENITRQTEITRMTFGKLPEGYELEWTDPDPQDGFCSVVIHYNAAATTRTGRTTTVKRGFTLTQCALTEEMAVFTDEKGNSLEKEEWEEIQDSYLLLDSVRNITTDDLHSKKTLRWTDGSCLYTFWWNLDPEMYTGPALCHDAPDYRNDARYLEIIGILQAVEAGKDNIE